jgi:hypothetical protein
VQVSAHRRPARQPTFLGVRCRAARHRTPVKPRPQRSSMGFARPHGKTPAGAGKAAQGRESQAQLGGLYGTGRWIGNRIRNGVQDQILAPADYAAGRPLASGAPERLGKAAAARFVWRFLRPSPLLWAGRRRSLGSQDLVWLSKADSQTDLLKVA